jgi:fucose 4-O-acetylase-like acetyltransferase
MNKVRYDWIDVAKGILICLMLYGHIRVYGPMDGLNDEPMRIMGYASGLYGAFFMQAFFIVTGFCATFKVAFKTYLWKNIKTLMLPTLLMVLFSEYYKLTLFSHQFNLEPIRNLSHWLVKGGPWFIWAMFWAKCVYWPISRLNLPYRAVAVSVIYLLGLLSCTLGVVNYQWYQHALLMVPYLFVGEWCRNNMEHVDKWLKPVAIAGAISILLQNVVCRLGFFSLLEHDFGICLSFRNFPVHVVNSIMGTTFIFWVSRNICEGKKFCTGLLCVLGAGTLVIYLWNGIVYRTIIRTLMPLYMLDRLLYSLAFHVLALVLCYAAFYFITRLIYGRKSIELDCR